MKDNIYKQTLNFIDQFEPLLKKFYGYTDELFYIEMVEAYNREVTYPRLVEKSKKRKDESTENFIERMKEEANKEQEKKEESEPQCINDILREKKVSLSLNFHEFNLDELKKKCFLPEYENNESIYSILFIVTYIASRWPNPFKRNPPELSLDQDFIQAHNYNNYVRPDMLELFLFQDALYDKFKYKKSEAPQITIKCGKHKIEISNRDNWFIEHLLCYLDEYLGAKDVKEAMAELELYKKKQGRNFENPLINRIIWGTYNLLKYYTAFSSGNRKITDKMCLFILDYLLFLKLIDEEHILYDNILQIRAIINYLERTNYDPYPWEFGFYSTFKRPQNIRQNHPGEYW